MLFQILLILLIAVIAAIAVRSLPGEKGLAIKRMIAILFVISAIVAITFPQLLSAVASFFGIGRGTDFLLYVFIAASLGFAAMTVRAKARSDARVTDLARAVALMEARLERQIQQKDHTE